MTTYENITIATMDSLITEVLPLIKKYRCLMFVGALGAGKTTFVQLLAKQLGVKGSVTSPTYTLIQEYPLANNKRLVHADLYRIKDDPYAMADLQLQEWFDDQTILCLEWAESIQQHLPKPLITVQLSYTDETTRTITVTVVE